MSCEQYWQVFEKTMLILVWFCIVAVPCFGFGMLFNEWRRYGK